MISKIDVRMKFRIITKNHATDSKIRSLQKSILEPMGLMSPTLEPGIYIFISYANKIDVDFCVFQNFQDFI